MSINFKPHGNSAHDETSGIRIPPPRILPEIRPDGSTGIEYQYSFRHEDRLIGSMGLSGTQTIIKTNGDREEIYKIEITQESTFEMILWLKSQIGNEDGNFDFIINIAQGLVAVFTEKEDNLFAQYNQVVTTREALERNKITTPNHIDAISKETIILAESYTPAHPIQSLQS